MMGHFKIFYFTLFVPFVITVLCEDILEHHELQEDFLLITVASEETDGYKRFIRSTKINNIPVKVLGLGKEWLGGNMLSTGGGYKVNLLKEELEKYKDDDSRIIMFTDSYDVIINGAVKNIVYRFKQLEARIVFSAESTCWPDESLAESYPVTESKYKYLNSGGFMGYAADLYNLLSTAPIANKDDDQLFFTNLFLKTEIREKYKIKLDYKSSIFQNLYNALDDIEMRLDDVFSYTENNKYGTIPIVIHGNGRSKFALLTVGNYLANSWNEAQGCLACSENTLQLPKDENDYPEVLLAVFISVPTPFMEEFFQKLENLDYPKKKIHLFMYNMVPYHSEEVDRFTSIAFEKYSSLKKILPSDKIGEAEARKLALKQWKVKKCGYYFNVDSYAHIDNSQTLKRLIEQNRQILAPMVVRPYRAWSNLWGAITKEGYYQRSFDYMSIVNGDRRLASTGRISVLNLNGHARAILPPPPPSRPLATSPPSTTTPGSVALRHQHTKHGRHHHKHHPQRFCYFSKHFRDQGVFMYVDNTVEYGHLIDPYSFDANRKHPNMYELTNNRYDWEQRYLHPDYVKNLEPNATIAQPCPDVYWFPVLNERFCKELIDIVENFGKWSDGSNKDERLPGGYENVPTRDIHMNQVDYERTWLELLQQFVRPIQEKVFIGYFHDPPRSLMNFVVRYRPDEQPLLRPHHDSSTYTVNLALNRPHIDYQGGGCKFIRYNCSVENTKVGWMLMHPGRLTHYHEGLLVTKGTRYIMISFVDP
ncbi:procollagen-lysine,2-oxoglutarate 5-dioxygenase [Nilaparvata lugens]|uniref:procollagen-lysine,2-oxoglutarate 5-dioxygenase n=1 Tax=Nilaparvata lugens TaxID=108931 RepID=UPI00193D3C41|nr:procollagen-lysine,2-oxoglutarate 5-dioxygenase [Nilaparvata lugens]